MSKSNCWESSTVDLLILFHVKVVFPRLYPHHTWHEHSAQTFIPDLSVVYKLPVTDGKWGTIRSNAPLITPVSGDVFTCRTFLDLAERLHNCHHVIFEASQWLTRTSNWRQSLTKVTTFQVMQWCGQKQIIFHHKFRTICFYFVEFRCRGGRWKDGWDTVMFAVFTDPDTSVNQHIEQTSGNVFFILYSLQMSFQVRKHRVIAYRSIIS